MILLDTHAAVWLATEDPNLGAQSRRQAEDASRNDDLLVSAISFWEIALLTAKNRLQTGTTPMELRTLLLESGVRELPLAGDIAILSVTLDGLHADPADRFIAATAIAHDAVLVTADDALLHWRHKALRRQDARK